MVSSSLDEQIIEGLRWLDDEKKKRVLKLIKQLSMQAAADMINEMREERVDEIIRAANGGVLPWDELKNQFE